MKTRFKTLPENQQDTEIKELLKNKNFRNNQNYIIDKEEIDRKLKYIFNPIDILEEKYTYITFLKILFSFIFLIFVFIFSVKLEQKPIYWEALLLIFSTKTFFIILSILSLVYLFYNSFLFYKKSFYFYPRRKKLYTIIKHSPFINYTKVIKK